MWVGGCACGAGGGSVCVFARYLRDTPSITHEVGGLVARLDMHH